MRHSSQTLNSLLMLMGMGFVSIIFTEKMLPLSRTGVTIEGKKQYVRLNKVRLEQNLGFLLKGWVDRV